MKELYVAFDGVTFENREECTLHEKEYVNDFFGEEFSAEGSTFTFMNGPDDIVRVVNIADEEDLKNLHNVLRWMDETYHNEIASCIDELNEEFIHNTIVFAFGEDYSYYSWKTVKEIVAEATEFSDHMHKYATEMCSIRLLNRYTNH